MKNKRKIIYIIVVIILLLISIIYLYVNNYYKADSNVDKYLKSNDKVKVSRLEKNYYFDGKGKDKAIVFYPGGKVEAIAYAPLLYKISEKGIDCFLINMPFNLAILNKNAANSVIDKYKYKEWYLSGHSLGGAVASMYIFDNVDKVSGLILLASYPANKIADNIKILSIYGSNDGILNFDKYESSKKYWNNNTKEIIIKGANHSGFSNYGLQSGDKKAFITREVQQQETINYIMNFLE